MGLMGFILQIIVIIGFLLFAYSKIKRQSLKETFEEIKIIIESLKNG